MKGCYILYSETLNKFYTGAIQDDLDKRVKKHNEHAYGNHRFTAKASDWKVFLFIECETYTQAIRIERQIKRMKSSVYIRNLKQYPEMVQQLLTKYKP
jgi:putative endonuclease